MHKSFAHSISIIFCNTISGIVYEDTIINETFLLGCFLVLFSSFIYMYLLQSTSHSSLSLSHSSSSSSLLSLPMSSLPLSSSVSQYNNHNNNNNIDMKVITTYGYNINNNNLSNTNINNHNNNIHNSSIKNENNDVETRRNNSITDGITIALASPSSFQQFPHISTTVPKNRLPTNSNSVGLYSLSNIIPIQHDISNEASISLDDVDHDHRDIYNHQHQNYDSFSPPDSIHSQGSNGTKSNGSNGSNGSKSNGSTRSYGFLHIDKRDISNSPDVMI